MGNNKWKTGLSPNQHKRGYCAEGSWKYSSDRNSFIGEVIFGIWIDLLGGVFAPSFDIARRIALSYWTKVKNSFCFGLSAVFQLVIASDHWLQESPFLFF